MLVLALELATTLFLTFVDSCTLSNMKKQTISLIFEMTVIRSYFVVQLEEHLTKKSIEASNPKWRCFLHCRMMQ